MRVLVGPPEPLEACAGAMGLGPRAWPMVGTKRFSVKGHEARPSAISVVLGGKRAVCQRVLNLIAAGQREKTLLSTGARVTRVVFAEAIDPGARGARAAWRGRLDANTGTFGSGPRAVSLVREQSGALGASSEKTDGAAQQPSRRGALAPGAAHLLTDGDDGAHVSDAHAPAHRPTTIAPRCSRARRAMGSSLRLRPGAGRCGPGAPNDWTQGMRSGRWVLGVPAGRLLNGRRRPGTTAPRAHRVARARRRRARRHHLRGRRGWWRHTPPLRRRASPPRCPRG